MLAGEYEAMLEASGLSSFYIHPAISRLGQYAVCPLVEVVFMGTWEHGNMGRTSSSIKRKTDIYNNLNYLFGTSLPR